MIERFKLFMATALASLALCFGFVATPITAFAEEPTESVEISVETNKVVEDEEVVEESEIVENTAKESVVEETEEKEITYDDILALMGNIAEKEGFKDEWDKTLYHLETAASEKKVDTMILLIALVLAFLTIYVVVKLVKHKLSNEKIRKIINSITGVETNGNAQTKAINGLIEEAEVVESVAADGVRREKALANALEKQNVAIRALIRGTNIKQELKDEAFRSLNESDDLCDEAKK